MRCSSLQRCAQEEAKASSEAGAAQQEGVSQVLSDPDYVNSLLSSLPGVDVSDPALQGALASLAKPGGGEDKDGGKKEADRKDKQ